VKLPPRALLTFGIGVQLRKTPPPPGQRWRFSVHAGETASGFEVYRRDLPLARAEEWIDQEVDLGRFAGKEVWLSFAHGAAGGGEGSEAASLVAGFADPIIHDRARYGRARGVVLISIDTLRRDHLSLYGYRRKTTPALDELGEASVVFEDAVSTSSWTLPAHGSLLTALYPSAHGGVTLHTGLPRGLPSLQESLRRAGFFTQAIVSHLYLSPFYGFDDGFDRHRYLPDRRAKELTDRAIGFLRSRGDRDFFLFLHYYDPHWHYDPPPPYDRTFDPSYRGQATGIWWDFKERTAESIREEELRHILALYDGEILYTDRQVERLLREMKRLGLFDPAVVVVTSDHGEEFLDHGAWEHQKTLYEEQLRVPLLLKLPNGEGRGVRIDRQVRLVDVAPTVLEAVGVGAPPSFHGQSLLPLVRGQADFPTEAWAETEHTLDGRHKLALRRGARGRKWILTSGKAGSTVELYDLAADPAERTDLARDGQRPAGADLTLRRMESFLAEARGRRAAGPPVRRPELSREQLQKLRALGYVR
jgi:arylsulfatase A-like enzyme